MFHLHYRYLDNRVFVSLANGDITIYSRDQGIVTYLLLSERQFVFFFVNF